MQTATVEPESRPLPVWMSIPIILLCLFGGGWIIHWYVMTDPLSHEAKILGDPQPLTAGQNFFAGGGQPLPGGRGRNNGNVNNNPRRFVRDNGGGRWDMRTEQARIANASLDNGKLNWGGVYYINYGFVPVDSQTTIVKALAIVKDNDRIAALKLTPAQVKKLRELSTARSMSMADADKNQLAAQVEAYLKAPVGARAALEPKVLQTLDDVAQKSVPATRQQVLDRAAQINAIMTPELWKLNAAAGGAPQ